MSPFDCKPDVDSQNWFESQLWRLLANGGVVTIDLTCARKRLAAAEKSVQEIESSIRNFIDTKLLYDNEKASYSNDTSLLDHGIIDSLGVVDLVEFLEMRFGIKVEQQEVRPENMDSIGTMAAFVRRKTSRT